MKETIREMAYLIELPIENWLEDTEAISPATTYKKLKMEEDLSIKIKEK